MMLKILLHRFFCDVARAPRTVPDGPEVSAPIPLAQRGKLLLEHPRCPSLEAFDQIRECLRRRILDVHVDMILAHHALEDADIFSITNLYQQISTANLEVALQDVVAVLRTPYDMRRQSRDGVPTMPIIFHAHTSTTP